MKSLSIIGVITLILCISSCKEESINTLSISKQVIEIPEEGGAVSFSIDTDAEEFAIDNPAKEWLILDYDEKNGPPYNVSVSIDSKTVEPRITTLSVHAGNATTQEILVTQSTVDFLYAFSVDTTSLSFHSEGGTDTLTITTTAPHWELIAADWVTITSSSVDATTWKYAITLDVNPLTQMRETELVLNGEYTPEQRITVTQEASVYPSYNTNPIEPDNSGMTSTAPEIADDITLGWNMGNTMEALGGETAWGNPKITPALIRLIKENGFNAIRLPASWDQYSNQSTAEISQTWLNRVKEVVQMIVDEDMYVIVNIHWDGGWLENNVNPENEEANILKQRAFWQQIATTLRDFDEHLLFASANEPNVDTKTQMEVLEAYHQTFVDAVRSTGGRNTYRTLVIQGPRTDIDKTYQLMRNLPVDPTPDRLMAEIHYYAPWNFCGLLEDASWGKMFYFWGKDYHSSTNPSRNATWGEEAEVERLFKRMKLLFVNNGIPVVLGEFEATRRSELPEADQDLHNASRAYYHKYVVSKAKEYGLIPFYWDNGGLNNHASGIFDRKNLKVFDQQVLDALFEGLEE